MKIAVLFDGAGLARLGLEQAGHECHGVELDPVKHHLSLLTGSGNCSLGDATSFDLSGYDAVWASPPCQLHSRARGNFPPTSPYAGDYLEWALNLPTPVLWVENVVPLDFKKYFGRPYNAAQFLEVPIQSRNRMIGGRYELPHVYRPYAQTYPGICPAVMATEYKGGPMSRNLAARFYGRRLTIHECAYHQGLDLPESWRRVPDWFDGTVNQWRIHIYEAIGNAVPVYMAYAFGKAYETSYSR